MNSIKENITNEIIINKSRFITTLIKIDNIDEIKNKLETIKKTYKDATHYCYAYIINGQEKCSDNGEPSGTAGPSHFKRPQTKQLNQYPMYRNKILWWY